MSPILSLILDLVLVGMLAATIAYAIILNREIVKLRESRGEMAELIRGLNEAMGRAETGVRSLKKAAADTGEELQRTVGKAQTLRDELEFMIEAADAMANRLGGVGDDRAKPAMDRSGAARPAGRPATGLSARPPIAARPMVPPVMDDHDDEDDDHDHDDAPPPLRADSFRGEPLRADPPLRRAPPQDQRDSIVREGESLSRAERELLQAIENAGKGIG